MQARVSRWGNSLAVRLPRSAVEELGLGEGESVDMRVEDGALVVRRARRRYRLDDLLDAIDPRSVPPALDVPPRGEELL